MKSKLFLCFFTLIATMLIPTTGLASNSWERISILNNEFVNRIKATPAGLIAGQDVLSPSGYNGLYVSYDLGKTWLQLGLGGRGITQITYDDGIIYVSTRNTVSGQVGFFTSSDYGKTWEHKGPNVPTTSVEVKEGIIYLGCDYPYGMYISKDSGKNWRNVLSKFGNSQDGVKYISAGSNTVLVSTYMGLYKSLDKGETFSKVDALFLKPIDKVYSLNNILFAGSTEYSNKGLYRSTDLGVTWTKINSWGLESLGDVAVINNTLYATRPSNDTSGYKTTVLKSKDFGLTWESTDLNVISNGYIPQITATYSAPNYVFMSGFGVGNYRLPLESYPTDKLQFLSKLWDRESMREQTDTISTYFDHTYPFLGYYSYFEPKEEQSTTTNFLGQKDTKPNIYYSSHDGIDFALPFGTAIKAPYQGYAEYSYSPLGGGNIIKITHPNGYQTNYYHLQKNGLVTTAKKIWVDKGTIIGKVGLSGNTTGPHLHFSVVNDSNNDSNFENDLPHGKVDPYSWESISYPDPWEGYTWKDSLGEHVGEKSLYLWEDIIDEFATTLHDGKFDYSNITLEIPQSQNPSPLTYKIVPFSQSNMTSLENNIKYIKNTSYVFETINLVGQKVTEFSDEIKLSIKLDPKYLKNINIESLKLKYYNQTTQTWNDLVSTFNPSTNIISGATKHFSNFAVFGNKLDLNPPTTTLSISGQKDDIWFVSEPQALLSSQEAQTTLYSLDGGENWEQYQNPINLDKQGVYGIMYRSFDESENYEKTKDQLLRVDTFHKFKDEIYIENGSFTIGTF